MKSLRNKISNTLSSMDEIKQSLFFQSLPEKEKKDFYKARHHLNELFITVNCKIIK